VYLELASNKNYSNFLYDEKNLLIKALWSGNSYSLEVMINPSLNYLLPNKCKKFDFERVFDVLASVFFFTSNTLM
jgi:hypothetical protein